MPLPDRVAATAHANWTHCRRGITIGRMFIGLAELVSQPLMLGLLAGAGIAFYVASKAAVDALGGSAGAGRLAIGIWMPVAAAALVLVASGRPVLGLGLALSTTIVCLTLGLGALTLVAKTVGPAPRRPAAALLLPATLLVLLAGLSGRLTLTHAASLGVLGLFTARGWRDPSVAPTPPATSPSPGRLLQGLLAVGLAGIGSWAALVGITELRPNNGIATPGLLVVTLVAPLLVLPMLSVGVDLAYRQKPVVAMQSLWAVALLNLCLLLPACVLTDAAAVAWNSMPATTPTSITRPQATQPVEPPEVTQVGVGRGIAFPVVNWRVDAVLLLVLAVFLLPVQLGRWPLQFGDGVGLVAVYLVYVLLAVVIKARSG